MAKIVLNNIKEISQEVDLIIAGKQNFIDNKLTFNRLNSISPKEISYADIVMTCDTILKIAVTTNKQLREIEKNFWRYIDRLPIAILMEYGTDIQENEELLSHTDYDKEFKKLISRVAGLAMDILALEDNKTKASEIRRSGSLSLLGNISTHYNIPNIKKVFVESMKSSNQEEQYEALIALDNYFSYSEEAIGAHILKIIEEIKGKTDKKKIFSICLSIQINTGLIDETSAEFEIEDWEDLYCENEDQNWEEDGWDENKD
ncbi:hypothetical protein ERX46_15890 [Brumimicrobium glaciale]|uniref:Uncharacterized protein n=1 Tax=Brumimicrobium glaciale TaxID=200475 RepID=A0A4Q4KGB5_9FLAO|nr:hypothetical protein [Brumimicrobium glaciale]RYM32162.1 hypothetical protein ERX46_15890 [Brumimicrobium glaciale]